MAWYYRSILICGLLCFGIMSEVRAYPTPVDLSGTVLHWNLTPDDPTLRIRIQYEEPRDFETFHDSITTAAELWGNIQGSLLKITETTGADEQITIFLDSALSGSEYASGYSHFDQIDPDGKPVHCESHILMDYNAGYVAISKTILHEIGHCLGLGHSLIPVAIMSYNLDKNRFGLDLDDMAAITRLYPLSGGNPELPLGCAVGSDLPAGGALWFMLLPLVSAVLRQRTRSKNLSEEQGLQEV